MLNHKYKKNCRVWQDSKLLSGLAPNYLFAVEIPDLFSMFIFWFLARQKLDKYFNTGRCDYFQENSGTGAVAQLFTDYSWQAGKFQSNYAHRSLCGSTKDELLPFMQKTTFQEPSAKSPSRDLLSRRYSVFSFSPLLRCAVPWNEAKLRAKQGKTANRLGSSTALCCSPALWKDTEYNSPRETESANSTQWNSSKCTPEWPPEHVSIQVSVYFNKRENYFNFSLMLFNSRKCKTQDLS